MPFQFCILGSGSSGNCIYLSSGRTSLLIDAGLSGVETLRRLGSIGVDPAGIGAICLTHEHSDHISGLSALSRRLNAALYANSAGVEAVERALKRKFSWQVFTTGFPFQVGDLVIEPFSVPHDAYDPVGFVAVSAGVRVAIVTDMGTPTTLIREKLKGCSAAVVEANYNEKLLRDSERPWSLKQRIAGRQGHMSNTAAAELIADVWTPVLTHVFLAHLSADCNRPDLAVQTIREEVERRGIQGVRIVPSFPDRPCEVWTSA